MSILTISLIKITRAKIFLIVSSLIIGYVSWSISSSMCTYTITVDVPLFFYNIDQKIVIESPEKISITIKGKRSDLTEFNPNQATVHYNAQKLHAGENYLTLQQEDFLLPPTINLINCKPLHPKIIVQ